MRHFQCRIGEVTALRDASVAEWRLLSYFKIVIYILKTQSAQQPTQNVFWIRQDWSTVMIYSKWKKDWLEKKKLSNSPSKLTYQRVSLLRTARILKIWIFSLTDIQTVNYLDITFETFKERYNNFSKMPFMLKTCRLLEIFYMAILSRRKEIMTFWSCNALVLLDQCNWSCTRRLRLSRYVHTSWLNICQGALFDLKSEKKNIWGQKKSGILCLQTSGIIP